MKRKKNIIHEILSNTLKHDNCTTYDPALTETIHSLKRKDWIEIFFQFDVYLSVDIPQQLTYLQKKITTTCEVYNYLRKKTYRKTGLQVDLHYDSRTFLVEIWVPTK